MVVKVNVIPANKLDHMRCAYVTLVVLKKMMDFTKVAQLMWSDVAGAAWLGRCYY